MEAFEESGDDMHNGTGKPTDGAVLERECALYPDRDYALARDLLGVIIAHYSDKIGEEEDCDTPNAVLLGDYYANERDYVLKQTELHKLSQEATLLAVEDYRAIISKLS